MSNYEINEKWMKFAFIVTGSIFLQSYWVSDNVYQDIVWNFVGKDSCNGDSGGPIAYREHPDDPWYQVGLVSFGTSKCGEGEPGVYTKIEGYLDWIAKHLEP